MNTLTHLIGDLRGQLIEHLAYLENFNANALETVDTNIVNESLDILVKIENIFKEALSASQDIIEKLTNENNSRKEASNCLMNQFSEALSKNLGFLNKLSYHNREIIVNGCLALITAGITAGVVYYIKNNENSTHYSNKGNKSESSFINFMDRNKLLIAIGYLGTFFGSICLHKAYTHYSAARIILQQSANYAAGFGVFG